MNRANPQSPGRPRKYTLSAKGRTVLRKSIRRAVRFAHSPTVKARRSQAIARTWADPEVRSKRIEGMKRGWSAKARKKASVSRKRLMADPKLRKRLSESISGTWADAEVRKKRIEGMNRPEVRKARSEGVKRAWATPRTRKKRIANMKRAWVNKPKLREQAAQKARNIWADQKRKVADLTAEVKRLQSDATRAKTVKSVLSHHREVGRKAEDEVWIMVVDLYDQGLKWDVVKTRVDLATGFPRTVKAYQEGRKRYLDRQKPTK